MQPVSSNDIDLTEACNLLEEYFRRRSDSVSFTRPTDEIQKLRSTLIKNQKNLDAGVFLKYSILIDILEGDVKSAIGRLDAFPRGRPNKERHEQLKEIINIIEDAAEHCGYEPMEEYAERRISLKVLLALHTRFHSNNRGKKEIYERVEKAVNQGRDDADLITIEMIKDFYEKHSLNAPRIPPKRGMPAVDSNGQPKRSMPSAVTTGPPPPAVNPLNISPKQLLDWARNYPEALRSLQEKIGMPHLIPQDPAHIQLGARPSYPATMQQQHPHMVGVPAPQHVPSSSQNNIVAPQPSTNAQLPVQHQPAMVRQPHQQQHPALMQLGDRPSYPASMQYPHPQFFGVSAPQQMACPSRVGIVAPQPSTNAQLPAQHQQGIVGQKHQQQHPALRQLGARPPYPTTMQHPHPYCVAGPPQVGIVAPQPSTNVQLPVQHQPGVVQHDLFLQHLLIQHPHQLRNMRQLAPGIVAGQHPTIPQHWNMAGPHFLGPVNQDVFQQGANIFQSPQSQRLQQPLTTVPVSEPLSMNAQHPRASQQYQQTINIAPNQRKHQPSQPVPLVQEQLNMDDYQNPRDLPNADSDAQPILRRKLMEQLVDQSTGPNLPVKQPSQSASMSQQQQHTLQQYELNSTGQHQEQLDAQPSRQEVVMGDQQNQQPPQKSQVSHSGSSLLQMCTDHFVRSGMTNVEIVRKLLLLRQHSGYQLDLPKEIVEMIKRTQEAVEIPNALEKANSQLQQPQLVPPVQEIPNPRDLQNADFVEHPILKRKLMEQLVDPSTGPNLPVQQPSQSTSMSRQQQPLGIAAQQQTHTPQQLQRDELLPIGQQRGQPDFQPIHQDVDVNMEDLQNQQPPQILQVSLAGPSTLQPNDDYLVMPDGESVKELPSVSPGSYIDFPKEQAEWIKRTQQALLIPEDQKFRLMVEIDVHQKDTKAAYERLRSSFMLGKQTSVFLTISRKIESSSRETGYEPKEVYGGREFSITELLTLHRMLFAVDQHPDQIEEMINCAVQIMNRHKEEVRSNVTIEQVREFVRKWRHLQEEAKKELGEPHSTQQQQQPTTSTDQQQQSTTSTQQQQQPTISTLQQQQPSTSRSSELNPQHSSNQGQGKPSTSRSTSD